MWNAGKTPARIIEIISPAGFENGFRELLDMTAAGPPDMAKVAEMTESSYGMRFAEPDWLPDVIARYELTPPPGP